MLNSHGGHGVIPVRMETLRHQIFTVARHKFAWPGGYAMVLVMADGAVLCADCVRENAALIARSTRDPKSRTGWEASGVSTVECCEPGDEFCANCSRDTSTL